MNMTFMNSSYNYNLDFGIKQEKDSLDWGVDWKAKMDDYALKTSFTYNANQQHKLNFGVESILHTFQPGDIEAHFNGQNFDFNLIDNQTLENALYIGDHFNVSKKVKFYYGLHYAFASNIGPATSYSYDEEGEVTDTTQYSRGDIYNTYHGAEPRFSGTYILNSQSSVKVGYARMQ